MHRRKPCRWWIGLVTVQPLITCGNHPVGPLIPPIGKPITKVAWQSGLAGPRLHRLDVVGHPLRRHHDAFRCGRTNVQRQARCPGDHHRAVGKPIRASRRTGLRQGRMRCHCQCVSGPDEPCRSGYPQSASRAAGGVWQPDASPGAPVPVSGGTPVMRRFRHPVDQSEERGTACRRPRNRDCPRRRGPASPPPASRAGA